MSAPCCRTPSIIFPWDTLIAVGIGPAAFAWGVISGFNIGELQQITRAAATGRESGTRTGPGGHPTPA